MNDAYVDQSAMDLNLCLYAGVPDLEGKVHLFKECSRELLPIGMSLRLGIIGASHFFSCRSSDGSKTSYGFTELLACTEPPLFSGVKHVLPFRILSDGGFGSEMRVGFPLVGYDFSGVVQRATPKRLAEVVRFREKLLALKLRDDSMGTELALTHDFSVSDGDDTVPRDEPFHAETLLLLEILALSRLVLTTVHTYPNENKIVLTTSTLFVKEDDPEN